MRMLGNATKNPLHLGHETHVGHAVSFVKYQDVELFDVHFASIAQVDESPRCGDNDVTAPSKLLNLPFDVGTAVDRSNAKSEGGSEGLQHFVHLHTKFSRRK